MVDEITFDLYRAKGRGFNCNKDIFIKLLTTNLHIRGIILTDDTKEGWTQLTREGGGGCVTGHCGIVVMAKDPKVANGADRE